MKKILAALIVSVALPAAACHAHDNCLGFGTSGTISYGFRIKICGCLHWSPCGCSAPSCCGCGSGGGGYGGGYGGAPWYTYWPLEAHFQVPAPTGYPFWPSPMAPMMTPPAAYDYNPGAHQQVGYFGPAPSYWYGN
jgi:hypothetical protein